MSDERIQVLIAGGGVAGIEALLALRDLAGDRVEVTLVAPSPDFIYKPLTVEAPFSSEPPIQLDLPALVEESGGTFVQKGVRRLDPDAETVELDDGSSLGFDAAIVCIGAKPRVAFGHAETLRTSGEPIDIDGLLRTAAEHESGRIAFVVPPTGSWPLPVYELALMAERRARELSVEVGITIRTPEPEPLRRVRPHRERGHRLAARPGGESRFGAEPAPARAPTERS